MFPPCPLHLLAHQLGSRPKLGYSMTRSQRSRCTIFKALAAARQDLQHEFVGPGTELLADSVQALQKEAAALERQAGLWQQRHLESERRRYSPTFSGSTTLPVSAHLMESERQAAARSLDAYLTQAPMEQPLLRSKGHPRSENEALQDKLAWVLDRMQGQEAALHASGAEVASVKSELRSSQQNAQALQRLLDHRERELSSARCEAANKAPHALKSALRGTLDVYNPMEHSRRTAASALDTHLRCQRLPAFENSLEADASRLKDAQVEVLHTELHAAQAKIEWHEKRAKHLGEEARSAQIALHSVGTSAPSQNRRLNEQMETVRNLRNELNDAKHSQGLRGAMLEEEVHTLRRELQRMKLGRMDERTELPALPSGDLSSVSPVTHHHTHQAKASARSLDLHLCEASAAAKAPLIVSPKPTRPAPTQAELDELRRELIHTIDRHDNAEEKARERSATAEAANAELRCAHNALRRHEGLLSMKEAELVSLKSELRMETANREVNQVALEKHKKQVVERMENECAAKAQDCTKLEKQAAALELRTAQLEATLMRKSGEHVEAAKHAEALRAEKKSLEESNRKLRLDLQEAIGQFVRLGGVPFSMGDGNGIFSTSRKGHSQGPSGRRRHPEALAAQRVPGVESAYYSGSPFARRLRGEVYSARGQPDATMPAMHRDLGVSFQEGVCGTEWQKP